MTAKLNKPMGIFGGTFDPIHVGHTSVALHLLETLPLEAIQLIPSNQPPHKKTPHASAKERLSMVEFELENHPKLFVNTCEIDRGGVSYMADTLAYLRKQLPITPLCLILGVDAFSMLNQWHQWESILSFAHIIVVNRPGYTIPEHKWLRDLCSLSLTTNKTDLCNSLSGKIYTETIKPSDISATQIRQALKKQLPCDKKLSAAVLRYIKEKNLYQN